MTAAFSVNAPRHVTVEDRAVIGGLAAVHQFCKIGRSAMIGGQAHVNQDVPPFMIVSGQPAYVFGLNSVGLARAGIPQAERSQLKKAFRILYRSGLSLQEAIATMEQELDSCEPVEHLMRFLRTAERKLKPWGCFPVSGICLLMLQNLPKNAAAV